MYTSSHIRRHIFKLTDNTIFSTREFLNFGKRAAVDKCLSRLVKRGQIIRLARGLFKKFDGGPLPSAYIVAMHKAQAFGRQIVAHSAQAAKSLGLTSDNIEELNKTESENCHLAGPMFAISSHSSKFNYHNKIIRFQGISPRKMFLGESRVGLAIRALWHLGQYGCSQKAISLAMAKFDRHQRQEFRHLAYIMPAWLADNIFCP